MIAKTLLAFLPFILSFGLWFYRCKLRSLFCCRFVFLILFDLFIWASLLGSLTLFIYSILAYQKAAIHQYQWSQFLIFSYEDQCQSSLRPMGLQLTHTDRQLVFTKRRLPRPLAAFLDAFRLEYRGRRALNTDIRPSTRKTQ